MERGLPLAAGLLLSACLANPALEPVELERASAEALPQHRPLADGDGARFRSGAVVGPDGARFAGVRFGLRALGRDEPRAVETGVVEIEGAEARVVRAGVLEWWRSLPRGLEHGVTLASRPPGAGALVLLVGVEGLRAEDDAGGVALTEDGSVRARYGELVVRDADGRRVRGALLARGDHVRIEVDDRGARYPLVVDPLLTPVLEASILPADVLNLDRFGYSVALDRSGTRLLVGVPFDDTTRGTNAGSARVLVRSGTTWTQEATLTAGDGMADDQLGYAVAIDADGDVAAIAAPLDDTVDGMDHGSIRIFTRTGTVWTERATLTSSAVAALSWFGLELAISGDGTHVIAGATNDRDAGGLETGSATIFGGSGASWSTEAHLFPTPAADGDYFGGAVTLDDTGARAIVGALRADAPGTSDAGGAYVFLRSGATWTLETVLRPPGAATGSAVGSGVSISSDGTVALVGMAGDDSSAMDAGATLAFRRTGTSWALEGSVPGARANANCGQVVALSADGMVGATHCYPDVRLVVRAGSTWTDAGVIPGTLGGGSFGQSLALDGSGTRLAGGDSSDSSGGTLRGRARVYTFVPGLPNGAPCASGGSDCLSGFCNDGVCCDVACDNDCASCVLSDTGVADGTCAPLPAGARQCRSGGERGVCDAEELCDGTNLDCPPDRDEPSTTVCRAASGPCDVDERCPGTGPDCPADRARPAGTVCRASSGGCDAAEVCDGTASACPGDLRAAAGVVCRSIAGDCDVEERCDGSSASCPADGVVSDVVCRPAVGPCDVAESCSGANAACPSDGFLPATTVCNGIVADLCDAPDLCSGTTADCPATYLVGVECRAAAGACDAAEVCVGDTATCPADAVAAAGMACRVSSGPCDPAELCDGVGATCSADVVGCLDASAEDGGAGSDAGGTGADAALAPDAGSPAAVTGCGCRLGPARAPNGLVLTLALAFVLAARRRS